ncbi:hypothetical protein GCM10020367_37940 [Streptomyces sannanensis]|uniref:Uncharacterized protein n=1 Tax=Streptomyces sannanensis TaxID=285536 RepID=A0ABP6SE77_9ACTN
MIAEITTQPTRWVAEPRTEGPRVPLLGITWMKDSALEDADSDLAPEVIAQEIVQDLQAALAEFAAIAEALGGEVGEDADPQ